MTTTRAGTAGALTGAMISAAFALAWAMWGASGLPSGPAAVIRIVAVLAGLSLIARAAVLRRSSPRGAHEDSLFSSTAYRRIVVVEVIALFGGAAVLGATGETAYTIVWFALIVAAHFLAFGRHGTRRRYGSLPGERVDGAQGRSAIGLRAYG